MKSNRRSRFYNRLRFSAVNVFEIKLIFSYQNIMINVRVRYYYRVVLAVLLL